MPAAEARIQYGIIRCTCYRYPIIDGIAILRQRSGSADTVDKGVTYLEAGDTEGALHYAFYCASPIPPAQSRWQRAVDSLPFRHRSAGLHLPNQSLTFRQSLHLHRPPGFADYLFHRHANNSFLAAIPLLLLLKELQSPANLTVLDLNCGVGHASFLMRTLFPNISVIATDHDFVNLYLARRHMIPNTCCICLDSELPLPFGDRFLDAVLCLDGLHYVRSKRALLKELDRSLKEAGIWLFPHMHNGLAKNVSPGVPLRPSDYQRCFDFLPSRLCIESEIFQNFMQNQTLDLTESRSTEQLDRAPVLSLVASRKTDIWRRHDRLAERLHTKANLRVNPLYHRNGSDREGVHLRMAWPNATLERECEPVKEFLPQECNIDSSLWARLQGGTLREEDEPEVRRLVKSFVLVSLPDNYA